MITLAVINEELAMEATFDRVIVLEDPYKSGRECSSCAGLGHQGVLCTECLGNKRYRGKITSSDDCTTCTVGQNVFKKSLGFMPCSVCKGTGTSSIFIPDDAQVRPTTGVIKSVGPLCGFIRLNSEWVELPKEVQLKVGERVLYHNHCGNIFHLGPKSDVIIRYIKESEILGRLHGVVKKTPTQGEFKDLQEVGIQ